MLPYARDWSNRRDEALSEFVVRRGFAIRRVYLFQKRGIRVNIDLFGNQVSLASSGSVESWNAMQLAFLAHGSATPTHLGAVLEAEPGFAMAQALKGLFCLMLGRSEMTQAARDANATAQAAILQGGATTEREKRYAMALDLWLGGSAHAAIAQMEKIMAAHPGDALALKISHAIRFILGDADGMRESIEARLQAYDNTHPAWGYVMGCYAFALEETGDYKRAETVGHQAVMHASDDAWGLHAVAHVYDMTGQSDVGLKWLNNNERSWEHCNNFRYHVWWHKALMHLDQGQVDEVLHLYDAHVRKDKTDDYRDISNATSLLMRLELEGVNVGDRWEEMAEISATRTEDGCLIFADLHYLLALMDGRREDALSTLVTRIKDDAQKSETTAQLRMARPGMSAAAGLAAFGDGDYRTAFLNLRQARPVMQDAGGSHAQRDVFERITIDAGIRAGFWDEAATILDDRKARRAGKEDAYAAARYEMISTARNQDDAALKMPAE